MPAAPPTNATAADRRRPRGLFGRLHARPVGGLMRAVLKSANLERLNARGADLSRVDLEFPFAEGAPT
jgi:uncharacterized protein YjbI with pentapeptide repeats